MLQQFLKEAIQDFKIKSYENVTEKEQEEKKKIKLFISQIILSHCFPYNELKM